MSASEIVTAALAYVPRTLPLDGKRPLLSDWPNVIATRELVDQWWRRWPDANVGIRTGSGLAVLDVDDKDGVHDTLAALEAAHGPLPATPEAVTGRNGRHLHFRAPLDLASRRLGPGLELKAAGCQVASPPSVHADTGRLYAWHPAHPFEPAAIADLPSWLLPEVPPVPRRAAMRHEHGDDPLRAIPAGRYVPELTGRTVTARGYVACPFHGDGQERTPSLLAGGRDPALWHCFACGAGGSIYDLAARLAGYALPLRGAAFLTVRDGLAGHYLEREQGAA